MSIERKDPAIIKLFGRTIPLPSSCGVNDKDLSSKERTCKSPNSNSKSGIAMKKPDKILACPRCTSSDTKFCYFNNYNVNQPRHFCRQCQRYWTAGGAMRDVPVGAGRRRRKDKNSASHNKHCQELKFNGTVLSFGTADTLTDTWSSFAYSSILGKHTGDGDEKCLWVPKTLRID